MIGAHAAIIPRLISKILEKAFGTPPHVTFVDLTEPERAVRTMQMTAVLGQDKSSLDAKKSGTHNTPSPISSSNPSFVLLFNCTFQRRTTGNPAQTKSVTMENTAPLR